MAAINVLCGSNAAEHVQDYTAPTQSVAHLCDPWKDGFLRHTAALWMPPIIFVPPNRTNEQGWGQTTPVTIVHIFVLKVNKLLHYCSKPIVQNVTCSMAQPAVDNIS